MGFASKSEPRFEAVLFDFDGTLIDTGRLILESFKYTLERFMDEVPADGEILRNVGIPLRVQMEEFVPGRSDEMVAVYREHNHANHDVLAAPFPHVDEVLGKLKDRATPMAVVTSKGRRGVQKGIDLIGLDRYIDVVITADDVELHKPDPYPLRVAAERLGVVLEHSIYVGDSPHDIAAAKAGGAASAGALWGIFPESVVLAAQPDFALSDMRELLALLDGDS